MNYTRSSLRGGYRVGSGRKPKPGRDADDGPEDTTEDELFWVIGNTVIPKESDDIDDLRAVRDRVSPLLRQLGLTPMTTKKTRLNVTGRMRNQYRHHRRIDSDFIVASIADNPGATIEDMAKELYCQNDKEWTLQDQTAATSKLYVHLHRLKPLNLVDIRPDDHGAKRLYKATD